MKRLWLLALAAIAFTGVAATTYTITQLTLNTNPSNGTLVEIYDPSATPKSGKYMLTNLATKAYAVNKAGDTMAGNLGLGSGSLLLGTNALTASGTDLTWNGSSVGGNMVNSGASSIGMFPVYTDISGLNVTPTNTLDTLSTETLTLPGIGANKYLMTDANTNVVGTERLDVPLTTGDATYVDVSNANQTNQITGNVSFAYATNGVDGYVMTHVRYLENYSGTNYTLSIPDFWNVGALSLVPTTLTNGTTTKLTVTSKGPTSDYPQQTNVFCTFEYTKPGGISQYTYFFQENFEKATTGYDDPAWSETKVGTIDPTASSIGLNMQGAQCLNINLATNMGITVKDFPVAYDEMYFSFKLRVNDLNGGAYLFHLLKPGNSPMVSLYLNSSNMRLVLDCGGPSASPADAISFDTTYYVWGRYKKSTGSDGIVELEFSDTPLKTGSGSKFATLTNLTITDQFQGIEFGYSGAEAIDYYVDRVRLSNAAIGSYP